MQSKIKRLEEDDKRHKVYIKDQQQQLQRLEREKAIAEADKAR